MNLQNLLPTLSKNAGLNITLVDSDDTNLITFNAEGYESIESDLFTRTVSKITVDSNKSMKVKLNAAL